MASNKKIYGNRIQKKTIDKNLDPFLDEKSLKNTIRSFLKDKCYHCNKNIVNPKKFDGNHVCVDCVNYYLYCTKKGCKKTKHIDDAKQCKSCCAWYCKKHKKKVCPCKQVDVMLVSTCLN